MVFVPRMLPLVVAVAPKSNCKVPLLSLRMSSSYEDPHRLETVRSAEADAAPAPPSTESVEAVHAVVDAATSAIDFATLIGRLKTTPRTGWVRRGVPRYESVADHSWRVAAMTLLLLGQQKRQPPTDPAGVSVASPDADPQCLDLDGAKCLQMAVIHDLAECLVGDIAPGDNVSSEDKRRREGDAMAQLASSLGKATSRRDAESHLLDLFHEYEERETAEAKSVKDLDLLDMILQADEYERSFGIDLDEFFSGTPPSRFHNPWIRTLAQQVHNRRSDRMIAARDCSGAETNVASERLALTSSDAAFVDEFSKASKLSRDEIAQIVGALRGWESRSSRAA
jgi:putative hydrolases of HD superfamily